MRWAVSLVLLWLCAMPSQAQYNSFPPGVFTSRAALDAAPSGGLLLDNISNVYIGYSTRKLRSAYAGSALQAKESTGGTTMDIGFDGGGNLDSTALSTFCGAAPNCTLNKWYDQSGNAIDGTGAGNVLLMASGVAKTINSHVCPNSTSTASKNITFTGAISQPDTISALFKYDTNSNVFLFDGTSTNRQAFGNRTGPVWGMYSGSALPTGGTADTSVHAGFAIFNSPNSNVFVDGTNPIVNQITGTNTLAGEQIFIDQGGLAIVGSICEFIVQNAAQSSGDRSTIRASWQTYWGAP